MAKFMPMLLISGGAALATVGAADSHDLSRGIGVIGGNTLGPYNLNPCPSQGHQYHLSDRPTQLDALQPFFRPRFRRRSALALKHDGSEENIATCR